MSKPFIRPNVLVVWAGKALGRATALAHVRHGCLPILTDPDAKALEKIGLLLESKEVEVFNLSWPGGFASLKNEGNFEKAFADVLARTYEEFPHLHRIVLTAGVDGRLGGSPESAAGEAGEGVLERLKILVRLSLEALKKQASPGVLTIIWPAPEFSLWSAETAAAGLAWLRETAQQADAFGAGVSLVIVGPIELEAAEAVPRGQGGQGDKRQRAEAAKKAEAAPAAKSPLIRLGEAGESVALLGELPRNILPREIHLTVRSVEAPKIEK